MKTVIADGNPDMGLFMQEKKEKKRKKKREKKRSFCPDVLATANKTPILTMSVASKRGRYVVIRMLGAWAGWFFFFCLISLCCR